MSKSFWEKIEKPIIALAPMDGYTDSAFRRVCKLVNPNIVVYTEFTSADGLHHSAKKLQQKLKFHPSEKPIIAQIFGKNIDTFVTATKYCESLGFDGVDLNMGCPAKKVVKSEHGVALRKKPELAFKLVEAVANASSLPVSVKTRLGWESADDLESFAIGVQNAGANCLAIHGRTYTQGFSENADFNPIYELKKKLIIPVIGNGDISSITDGVTKLGNLDGFMIGRASIGNPWVFSTSAAPTFADKVPLIMKHAEYLIELKGEKVTMLEMRKHLLAYVKGLPNASQYRSELVYISSLRTIKSALSIIAAKN